MLNILPHRRDIGWYNEVIRKSSWIFFIADNLIWIACRHWCVLSRLNVAQYFGKRTLIMSCLIHCSTLYCYSIVFMGELVPQADTQTITPWLPGQFSGFILVNVWLRTNLWKLILNQLFAKKHSTTSNVIPMRKMSLTWIKEIKEEKIFLARKSI